jgi:hypothetical protein
MINLWDEHFWLPENTTWKSFYGDPTIQYPYFHELYYTIIVGALLVVLRILIESFVFLPFGVICGWVNTKQQSLSSRIIEHLFFGFAGKKKFKRVAESSWRFVYYLCAFFAGLYILKDEPQFSNVADCWKNWPHQNVPDNVWWYYIIETGFYWSLLFSTIVFDVRRADFMQMMLHHFVTILLLSLSFSINFIRVGTLVLLSHDAADILLDLLKLFRYANWDMALNVGYLVFMAIWISSRLIYYPFWVINSTIYDAPRMIQENYRYEDLFQRPICPRLLVGMLCTLVFLHIFWTYVLIKIAIQATTTTGKMEDIRESDDEDFDENAPPPIQQKQQKKRN